MSGSNANQNPPGPFAIKDCALVAVSTALKAYTLSELRDRLLTAPPSSVHYHFWGSRLVPRFEDPEFNNDFAAWARHGLHDAPLAERLAVVDPTRFPDLKDLKRELVEILEERLDESERVHWRRSETPFTFLRSQIVVFDTRRSIKRPETLGHAFTRMSVGSLFYHFIDARTRTEDNLDDFSAWLLGFGDAHRELVDRFAHVDPFFPTLPELRVQLTLLVKDCFRRAAR